jgi:hypothetical protein
MSAPSGHESKGTRERRRLFKLYAANLSIHAPSVEAKVGCPVFGCPICRSCWKEAAVEPDTLGVTIAHVYPEACGGRLKTLVCKRCNERIGSRYEHHVAQTYKLYDALSGHGTGKFPARVKFASGTAGVEVSRRGNHFHLETIEEQTNDADRDRIIEEIDRTGKIKFTLTGRAPESGRATVAMIHAAFLALFRQYGYEYTDGTDTKWIREMLLKDDPPSVFPIYTVLFPKNASTAGTVNKVGVARTREGVNCLAATLPTPEHDCETRMVLLPGFGEKAAEEYKKIVFDMPQGEVGIKYAGETSDPEERLADPRYRFFLREIWQEALTLKWD